MASVQIEKLHKKYGDSVAVDALDLSIRDGEFLTLLGPSGCGKTTTLRCIAGLEKADGGVVRIGDEVVDDAAGRTHIPPEKRDIGMVFQSYALWPHMSIAANVGYPLKMRGVRRNDLNSRVTSALDMVGLNGREQFSPSELSGGQQQRVALARALVAEPRLILFDEPLSNLDARLRAMMRAELREMHQRIGRTSIYVTHDQEEALTLADRIVVINQGAIEQVGSPREIYREPASRFVADFIGFDNIFGGRAIERRDSLALVELVGSGQHVWVEDPGSITADSAVDIAIRGSAFQLARGDSREQNCLKGTVVTYTYLGDSFELKLDIGGMRASATVGLGEVAARWPSGGSPVSGEPVQLSIAAENCACLPVK